MIPLESTDKRIYELNYIVGFPYGTLILEFSQLDLMRIIKALDRIDNKKLKNKIVEFIKKVDNRENEETLFDRDIPRRSI